MSIFRRSSTRIRVGQCVFSTDDVKSWHRNGEGSLVVVYRAADSMDQFAISTPESADAVEAHLRLYILVTQDFDVKDKS